MKFFHALMVYLFKASFRVCLSPQKGERVAALFKPQTTEDSSFNPILTVIGMINPGLLTIDLPPHD